MKLNFLENFKSNVMESSRQTKLDHFYGLCDEGSSVLDVGVSSEGAAGRRTRNYFMKNFRFAPELYTGLGVEDLSGMDRQFPGKRFVRYPGGQFPFDDNQFDWVFSNAVIEHVGDDADQVRFVNEMLRVGKRVFFTTPNKYFPIESHTNAVLLHWNNRVFYAWSKKYKPWCTRDSVYLFSGRRLKSIMRQSDAPDFDISRNRFLGWTMTFTVVCPAA